MKPDRRAQLVKQLFSTGGLRFVGLPVSAIGSVLTARITVEATGLDLYGQINMVAMLIQLLPIADLGAGASVTNAVSRMFDTDESRYAARVTYGSALVLLSWTTVALVCVVFVFTGTGVLQGVLGIDTNGYRLTGLPISLVLVIYFVAIPFGLGNGLLIGMGRSGTVAAAGITTPTIILGFTAIASALQFSPFYFALGPALGILGANVLMTYLGLRQLRWSASEVFQVGHHVTRSIVLGILQTAWPMLLTSLTFAVIMHSHRIFLSHYATAAELSTYALAFQIFLPLWSVVRMASTVLWPEFSRDPHNRRLWVMGNCLLTFAGITAAAGLIFAGPWLLRLMAGESREASSLFIALGILLIALSLNATQAVQLTRGVGLRLRAATAVLTAVVFLTVAPFATESGGSVGLVYATVVCYLVFQVAPGLVFGLNATRKSKRVK